jgi:hypothetical protein
MPSQHLLSVFCIKKNNLLIHQAMTMDKKNVAHNGS